MKVVKELIYKQQLRVKKKKNTHTNMHAKETPEMSG